MKMSLWPDKLPAVLNESPHAVVFLSNSDFTAGDLCPAAGGVQKELHTAVRVAAGQPSSRANY